MFNSGGRVISYADIRVHGNIIAKTTSYRHPVTHDHNRLVLVQLLLVTTLDDNHDFTGSLFVKGKVFPSCTK